MYEIYQELLDKKGLKNSDVSRGTGVSNMTLSDWKHGETTPKTSTMQKIADFLGVSVDYLMTGKDNRFSEEMADLDADVIFLSKEIKEYAIKLSKLSEDDKADIMKMIDRLGKQV